MLGGGHQRDRGEASGRWARDLPVMTLWHGEQGSTSDNSPEHGRMVVQQVRQMTAFSRHLRLLLANPIRLYKYD